MLEFLWSKIYLSTPPFLFTKLFNLRGTLRNTSISCSFIKSKKVYVVSDKGVTRLASTNSRVLLYINGFARRADLLFRIYLLDELNFPSNALIVDCGANMGDFYLALVNNISESFEYIGYEPSPLDFLCLEDNVKSIEGNVHLRQQALWNESKELDFFLDVESASSSIIEPKTFSSRTMVSAVRLDEQLSTPVFLIKVEAEGAEPEVLQGAIKLLPRVQYIVVDVGPERGKLQEETRDEVVSFMQNEGFEILRENRGHRKIVLFKNKKELMLSN